MVVLQRSTFLPDIQPSAVRPNPSAASVRFVVPCAAADERNMSGQKVHPGDVLIVADDEAQIALLESILRDYDWTILRARSRTDGLKIAKERCPRVIICDYDLPDGDGLTLVRSARQLPDLAKTYCIVMSASGSEVVLESADAGADDYLGKPFEPAEVVARVRIGMRIHDLHAKLRDAAITDSLTQLCNHDQFNRVMEAELQRSRRYGHAMSVIMADIDYFKAVNDTFGHMTGNNVLRAVAGVLKRCAREVDTVSRFGGEEFALILPQARADEAAVLAERIRTAIKEDISVDPHGQHRITMSFGVADTDDPEATSAPALLDLADRAMYAAKRAGRDRVVIAADARREEKGAPAINQHDVEWLQHRLAALSIQAKDVYMQSVASLLQALDEKDPYTARHALNVSFYARALATQMSLGDPLISAISNAGLLHDVGKVGVPDHILMKRTPLTDLERMVLEQVPVIGTRIVDHLRILESEVQIIRHQREHFDGSGYPGALRGEQIPIGSRVLLVADAFDAISTDRVYRARRTLDETLIEIRDKAGSQFDPAVVDALEGLLTRQRSIWQERIEDTVRTIGTPNEQRIESALAGTSVSV